MGHNPVMFHGIQELISHCTSVADIPSALDVVRNATNRGMATVAGVPNVLLGKPHTGNVSALELAEAGLLSILASDCLPSNLFMAAFGVARLRHATLGEAINVITITPAGAAGLTDRGVLADGCRADLVLCAEVNARPRVLRTLSSAE